MILWTPTVIAWDGDWSLYTVPNRSCRISKRQMKTQKLYVYLLTTSKMINLPIALKIGVLFFIILVSGAVCYGIDLLAAVALPIFCLSALVFYFLPLIEAVIRDHKNVMSIGLINLFLGWSVAGWIFALIFAIKRPKPENAYKVALEINVAEQKNCRFCSEPVKKAVVFCRYCGSSFD